LNPDSAVAIDAKSEERTFRSEANGLLPLSGHRSSVVWWEVKNPQPREAKKRKRLWNCAVGCLRYSRLAPRSRRPV